MSDLPLSEGDTTEMPEDLPEASGVGETDAPEPVGEAGEASPEENPVAADDRDAVSEEDAPEDAAEAEPSAETSKPEKKLPPRKIDDCLLQQLVEAALLTAPGPLSASKLTAFDPGLVSSDVRAAVSDLNDKYRANGHAFFIEEIAGGYRILTLKELGPRLSEFFTTRSKDRLSRAALETLAIIAYKQPVTRASIESIRGVAADSVVGNLTDLGLVRVSGQADAPGRPMLYATTKKFLDHFGLKSLKELPREKDFDAMEKA